MKFLVTNIDLPTKTKDDLLFNTKPKRIGKFSFWAEDMEEIKNSSLFSCFIDGYLRDLNQPCNDIRSQEQSVMAVLAETWPLPENISGSFSSVLINKKDFHLVLCNDLIGIYPLYYLIEKGEIFISNSLILLAHASKVEIDEAGVYQRCAGPEFSQIGSRTILKNCKRLLPGEYLSFNANGDLLSKLYDNSLYQNISAASQSHKLHRELWQAYKKEMEYCLNFSDSVKIALSGGIDSRLTLGAIPNNKRITCLTYGAKDNYETKIASRLAKLKNAEFRSYSMPQLHFPPYEILKKYTLETEAVYLCSWLEILENVENEKKVPFLLGDLSTALTGRSIKKFSTREFREKNFLKFYILNKDYVFETADDLNFSHWKDSVRKTYEQWYSEKRLKRFNLDISRQELLDCLSADLNEIFKRIADHKLPYSELYDELFNWYTHTRGPMAKQILINNSKYKSFCPSLSIQNLRRASNIHPNLRLNFRFIKKLFKDFPELKPLFRVPTSQAPLIPQNFPDLIKFPVWGLRSKLDHHFIRKMMKSKNMENRYRLFKSNNWVEVYQNPDLEENIKAYFNKNYLGKGYLDSLLIRSKQRRDLKEWPFANLEIINASSLNLELEIIKSSKMN